MGGGDQGVDRRPVRGDRAGAAVEGGVHQGVVLGRPVAIGVRLGDVADHGARPQPPHLLGLLVAAHQPGDRMSRRGKLGDHRMADVPRRSGHEDVHGSRSSGADLSSARLARSDGATGIS